MNGKPSDLNNGWSITVQFGPALSGSTAAVRIFKTCSLILMRSTNASSFAVREAYRVKKNPVRPEQFQLD